MFVGLVWPQHRMAGAKGRCACSLCEQPAPALNFVRGNCAAHDRLVPAQSAQGYGCSGLWSVSASQAVGTVPVRANVDRITGD